jgi:hypothetical protein
MYVLTDGNALLNVDKVFCIKSANRKVESMADDISERRR